jgi:AraC-like DNA-binding protein
MKSNNAHGTSDGSDCVYEYRIVPITMETREFRGCFPRCFHHHAEIILVDDGVLHAECIGQTAEAGAGELLMFFPDLLHSLRSDYTRFRCLMFLPDICYGYSELFRSKAPVNILMRDIPRGGVIDNCFDSIGGCLAREDRYAAGEAAGYIGVLMGEIAKRTAFTEVQKADNKVIYGVVSYCNQHFRDDITMQDVADALFISRAYVSYIFNRKLMCRFHDYMNYLRCCEAEYLLKNSAMPVTEVMYSSGYRNQSTFNRLFCSRNTVTPTQYRRRFQENGKNAAYAAGTSSVCFFPPLMIENTEFKKI